MNTLRAIPSVDFLLNLPDMTALTEEYGHEWCLQAIRQVLDEVRSQAGKTKSLPTDAEILFRVEALLKAKLIALGYT